MEKAVHFIKNNIENIIRLWEENVNEEIEASKSTDSLVLRNQLPHVLEDIAEIMDRYEDFEQVEKDEKFEEIINNSIDHGRHRASSSHYSIKQILQEYMILHRTLTDLLREENVFTNEVASLLKYTMETAMINSSDSFNQSIQEMREKLIGTLAHDLRNPLSTAYLAIDMLDCKNDPDRAPLVKKMVKRSMKNSLDLVEGLLDTIQVRAGEGITLHFSETDLMKDINWVYQEASEIYPNSIELNTELDRIHGVFDGAAVRRILENLVSNGVKYGAKDTTIAISVFSKQDDVIIQVHNEGRPIPVKKQQEIFQFMNKRKGGSRERMKSYGMGLFLVKTVAEAHGGKANLTSNKASGTTFEIILNKKANKPGVRKSELDPYSFSG